MRCWCQTYVYEGEKHPEDPTQQHGKGKAVYANGDEFSGEYKEGKRHGAGVYKWVKMTADEETGEEKIATDDEGNKVGWCYVGMLALMEGPRCFRASMKATMPTT